MYNWTLAELAELPADDQAETLAEYHAMPERARREPEHSRMIRKLRWTLAFPKLFGARDVQISRRPDG